MVGAVGGVEIENDDLDLVVKLETEFIIGPAEELDISRDDNDAEAGAVGGVDYYENDSMNSDAQPKEDGTSATSRFGNQIINVDDLSFEDGPVVKLEDDFVIGYVEEVDNLANVNDAEAGAVGGVDYYGNDTMNSDGQTGEAGTSATGHFGINVHDRNFEVILISDNGKDDEILTAGSHLNVYDAPGQKSEPAVKTELVEPMKRELPGNQKTMQGLLFDVIILSDSDEEK